MCDFCENIWDSIEDYKKGKYCWDERDIIYRSNGSTYLYLPCGNDYYNRSMEIYYCPMCGKKLEEKPPKSQCKCNGIRDRCNLSPKYQCEDD